MREGIAPIAVAGGADGPDAEHAGGSGKKVADGDRAGSGFLCRGDNYLCREGGRQEGGNDRVCLRQIHLRREDDRFYDGHRCLVSVNDRMPSRADYVRTINKHKASGNDRVRLRNKYLPGADNRF